MADHKGTILLVDDELGVRVLFHELLEDAGYQVLVAASGQEALMIAQEGGPQVDLLLTDVVMPDMNGVALATALKHIHPQLRVIYMSGYPQSVFAALTRDNPSQKFLPKPIATDELLAAVQAAVGQAKEAKSPVEEPYDRDL